MQANKNLLLLFFFLAISFHGIAQSSCVQKLRDARNAYDEGKLKELPDLLLGCIENGFSKEEKVEALRLVTLSYLFNEEQEKAEISYLRLLNIDPEYQVNEDSDPTELLILAEKFDTDPKFFYGFKIGAPYNIIDLEQEIIDSQTKPGTYEFPVGFSVGLFFQYPLNDKLSANAEVIYNYRATELNRPIGDTESSDFHHIGETQQWVEVPLLLNYKLPWVNRFLLEATGGPSFHYLFISSLNLEGRGENLNNFDMLPYRNQLNVSGNLGLRANFKKLGANFITAEMLFQFRFLNEVGSMPEDVQIRLANENGFKDFNYKTHALWLRLGIRFPYFKPELIK